MIISLHWLADHLDLTSLGVEEISQLLTFAGVEVEKIEQRGVASDRVVVAQVISSAQHPDADRLSVCRVEAGQDQPLQIVCGAKNFKVGDKVPLALEGAVLPGNLAIKKGRLRGIESHGMMCSGRELGLGDDHDGLLILPADAPVGTPLGAYLGSDTLLWIEVTPNRPDLLSHHGIARELRGLRAAAAPAHGSMPDHAGASGAPAPRAADPTPRTTSPGPNGFGIELRSPACPFYTVRIVRGAKIGPSPEWLRRKLESIGSRPINVVVDITNYVLHDLGQPLHAFDLSKLTSGIVVRAAVEGESLVALDGNSYALTPDDLVIADRTQAVALAGVMGGAETGVTESTTDVLIESAYFVSSGVRRTSRRLGLTSDSSYRFERGVDPAMVAAASDRAAALIVELTGGIASESLIVAGSEPAPPGTVSLRGDHVRRLLGSEVSDDEIASILSALGLSPAEPAGAGGSPAVDTDAVPVEWRIPSFRQDLARPVDLIEEVARVSGLDRIAARRHAHFAVPDSPDASYDFVIELKRRLAALGFFETLTIKLVAAKQLSDAVGFDRRRIEPLALKNPLSEDHTHLRPSLAPGLLGVAAHNLRQGAAALRFFETGTVFAASTNPKTGAAEAQALALLLSGPHVPPSWLKKSPHPVELTDLRGAIESLLGRRNLHLRKIEHPALLLAAEVVIDGKVVGICGQLSPARARELDARTPVFLAEFNLAVLEPLLSPHARYQELPRFPGITRDVALEMDASLPHGQIQEFFAKQIKEPLLESLELFDVFNDPTGEKLPAGRKSLAYSLTYRDRTRTLEAREIDAAHARILDALKAKLPITIR